MIHRASSKCTYLLNRWKEKMKLHGCIEESGAAKIGSGPWELHGFYVSTTGFSRIQPTNNGGEEDKMAPLRPWFRFQCWLIDQVERGSSFCSVGYISLTFQDKKSKKKKYCNCMEKHDKIWERVNNYLLTRLVLVICVCIILSACARS